MLYIGIVAALFLIRGMMDHALDARNRTYLFAIVAMFLFAAFRFQVGCDWSGYYAQYQIAEYQFFRTDEALSEPIWWAIMYLIKDSDLPYPVVNLISSAIFFVGVHILAKRQVDKLSFLILLFPVLIINMPMSGIRQGAAIGILCIAFVQFLDKRPLRFLFWTVIAIGFHASSMIFLLLAPLGAGEYSRGRMVLAGILAFPGLYYFLAVSGATELAIERYVDSDVESFGAPFRVGFMAISGAYFFVFLRRKWAEKYPEEIGLLEICAIAMVGLIAVLPLSSVIADRIAYFLVPIQAMIFARIPCFHFAGNREIHIVWPYAAMLVFFSAWATFSWHFSQCYVPYDTWLGGFPSGAQMIR